MPATPPSPAMQPDPDELAGVADLFGALTREELGTAFHDLAARSGDDFDADALDDAVEEALDGYYLVAVERGEVDGAGVEGAEVDGSGDGTGDRDGSEDRVLLASGPTALPRLPDGGEDLPHLVDVDHRSVDREALGRAAHVRLRGDAARAVADDDGDRIATLLDVCYDLEAWAPVETAELRDQLDGAL